MSTIIIRAKSWKFWMHGLGSAIIGGVANSVFLVMVDPTKFNLQEGRKDLLMVAGANAIWSAALYLKQSPLPPVEEK